jgi:C1A family cysteine protease
MNSKLLALSGYFQTLLFGVSDDMSPQEQQFQEYMAEYSKSYPSKEEYNMRFEIFKKHLDFVESHQSDSFSVAINDMSDWTDEEFARISGASHQKKRSSHRVATGVKVLPTDNLPREVDWRRSDAITAVVRQGSCGSCWAFTAAAALESYNKIAGGSLMRLAPQQLVDCGSNLAWGNFGCDGGFVDYAYAYAAVYPMIQEYDYPY